MKKLSSEIPATSTASAAPSMLSRRAALTGAAAVTLATVGGTALASAASAAPQVTGGANPPLDVSHATREVTELIVKMFQAKTAADLDGFMSFFSKSETTYTDPIWGGQWAGWDVLYAQMASIMPQWAPTVQAYP